MPLNSSSSFKPISYQGYGFIDIYIFLVCSVCHLNCVVRHCLINRFLDIVEVRRVVVVNGKRIVVVKNKRNRSRRSRITCRIGYGYNNAVPTVRKIINTDSSSGTRHRNRTARTNFVSTKNSCTRFRVGCSKCQRWSSFIHCISHRFRSRSWRDCRENGIDGHREVIENRGGFISGRIFHVDFHPIDAISYDWTIGRRFSIPCFCNLACSIIGNSGEESP